MGIEGTGHSVSVGLMTHGVPRGEIFNNSDSPSSQTLMVSVDQLLRQCQVKKEDLRGICVTLGPGSFTSMRICLSVAESMGLGLNIPIYGIDELILIAESVPFYPHSIKVIKNAYKGELYTATYDTSSGYAKLVDALNLITPDQFFRQLQANDLVLGNGIEKLRSEGFDILKKQAKSNSSYSRTVSGINVIEYFLDSGVKKPSDIPLEPLYIRLSEAELNYNKQFGKPG